MYVSQFTVFLPNLPGALAKLAGIISENNLDLAAITVADTSNFGLARGIAKDHERAVRVLEENGYAVTTNHVLVASLPDKPGGFARMLSLLSEGGVNVEYLYCSVRSDPGQAWIILRVDHAQTAVELLTGGGIRLLSQEEVIR